MRRVLTTWWSMDRRPSPQGAGQIREDSPRRVPILLDAARLADTTAALRNEILDGARCIPSLTRRRADSSGDNDDDDDDDDDDESGHPNNQHLCYPRIQSLLGAGGARHLGLSGSAGSVPALLGQGDDLHRLSDVHENPWILKAGTETFSGPCELTDDTTRTWVMKLKITTKLVCLTMQELHDHDWQFCEDLKEECFAIAGQCVEKLFEVACSFSDARWYVGNIPQQLTVCDALVDILSSIRDLCFVRSGEVAGIVNKMLSAFRGVIEGITNEIYSCTESTIDPATIVFIQVLEFFCRNKEMMQLILEPGDYNTDPCSDMSNCWVSKLKEGAEIMFQEKGQMCIFILNNAYYVLQMKCHPELLPPSVVSNLESLTEQYIRSYLEECWLPPMLSYLVGDSLKKPRCSSLDKFTGEFFSICDLQMIWKVRTELKQILREEIMNFIVPKYVSFSEALLANPRPCWYSKSKGMWHTRSEKPAYTGAQLEEAIRKLFER